MYVYAFNFAYLYMPRLLPIFSMGRNRCYVVLYCTYTHAFSNRMLLITARMSGIFTYEVANRRMGCRKDANPAGFPSSAIISSNPNLLLMFKSPSEDL